MRPPDLVIGPKDHPYIWRWHLIRWRGWQLALHKIWRSDDDRALHDHSGDNVSFILSVHGYHEIIGKGGLTVGRRAFVPYFRRAETPHRLVLLDKRPVWSLWLRWPPRREWGFWCPRGWVHWRIFTDGADYNKTGESVVGRGCDE